jgi:hypothetical protein
MPTLTYTILTIRCPHCMAGVEFRPMIAYNGRFVCRDCAHTLRPGVPEYTCTRRPCLSLLRTPLLTDHGSHLRSFIAISSLPIFLSPSADTRRFSTLD